MFQLRYYEPYYSMEVHNSIVSLLAEVKARHNIPHEIVQLSHRKDEQSGNYAADQAHQREIYRRDFVPRKNALRQRTGEPLRKLLRSKSGNYYVAGTVAITRNGQVEWFANYSTPFGNYDKIPALGFLRAVLDKGPSLLGELCPEVERENPELRILDTFVNSGVLKGRMAREVKIGRRIFEVEGATFDWRKSIDLLYETDPEVWILEGKPKLNYEAFGEALTYATLYSEEHAEKIVRPGIVCGMVEDEILLACVRYGVTVFEVIGNEVRPHASR